jgi:hypothetical protein
MAWLLLAEIELKIRQVKVAQTSSIDMDVLNYVKAASALLELPLDAARAEAVALQLGRTMEMARQLEDFDIALGVETSEIFCPAPFPSHDEGGSAA